MTTCWDRAMLRVRSGFSDPANHAAPGVKMLPMTPPDALNFELRQRLTAALLQAGLLVRADSYAKRSVRLNALERRRTAERGADLGADPGEVTTERGFGSGQDTASQSTRHGNVS